MDIGTAKPSAAERERVPHHLIDLVEPTESYSAARFRADAIRVVGEIFSRNRVPLLVGGTMLYYRVLESGLDALPSADPAIRAKLDEKAARLGWPSLHAELARIDPAAAHRITPNDSQRIRRALEVHRLTGRPISELQRGAKVPLPFELRAFSLVPEREHLHRRIAERFDAMLEAGLIDEVKSLRKKYRLNAAMPSMRAVGYRQVWNFLEGSVNKTEMRNQAIAATRQLAKRQLTWLRSFEDLERVEPPSLETLESLMFGSRSCR
jgi:tRNA dimethylallyltransferase